MVEFSEERVITVVIPVSETGFADYKEITELFDYVFEHSVIKHNYHPKNTFERVFECGKTVFKFTISLNGSRLDDDFYNTRKSELTDLADAYKIIEDEYLRFKKFGDIESRMLIRRPRV